MKVRIVIEFPGKSHSRPCERGYDLVQIFILVDASVEVRLRNQMNRDFIAFRRYFMRHFQKFHHIAHLVKMAHVGVIDCDLARSLEMLREQTAVTPTLTVLGNNDMLRLESHLRRAPGGAYGRSLSGFIGCGNKIVYRGFARILFELLYRGSCKSRILDFLRRLHFDDGAAGQRAVAEIISFESIVNT